MLHIWPRFWSQYCCTCLVLSKFILRECDDQREVRLRSPEKLRFRLMLWGDTQLLLPLLYIEVIIECCTVTNIMQFNSLAIFTSNQIALRHIQDSPFLYHDPPSAPGSLRKAISQVAMPLPGAGITRTLFPSMFLVCTTRNLSPSTLHKNFGQGQPGRQILWCLTRWLLLNM